MHFQVLFIICAEGHSPQIDKATFIETGGLRVNWSSDNTDIIKTEVIWENANLNIRNNTTVEWYRKEVIIDTFEHGVSYNVTVIEHNKCQDRFSSGKSLSMDSLLHLSLELVSANNE